MTTPGICAITLNHLRAFQGSLPTGGARASTVANQLMNQKTRNYAFNVEALARVLENRDDFFAKLDDKAKKIEDRVGGYSLHRELIEAATAAGFENGFIAYLKDEEKAAGQDLADYVNKRNWLKRVDSKVKNLIEEFKDIKFKDEETENRFYLKALRKYFRSMKEKILEVKELVFQKTYDFNALEEGLHEFRRLLRWVPILLQATRTMFHVEPAREPLSPDDRELIKKYKDDRFSQLSEKTEFTIGIPQLAFYRLNFLIGRIGEIKTNGEAEYYLTQRWMKYQKDVLGTRVKEEDAKAYVRSQLGENSSRGLEPQARELYSRYLEWNPIKEIMDAIKAALN